MYQKLKKPHKMKNKIKKKKRGKISDSMLPLAQKNSTASDRQMFGEKTSKTQTGKRTFLRKICQNSGS